MQYEGESPGSDDLSGGNSSLDTPPPETQEVAPTSTYHDVNRQPGWRFLTSWVSIGILGVLILGLLVTIVIRKSTDKTSLLVGNFDTVTLPLDSLNADSQDDLADPKVTIGGQLEVGSSIVLTPSGQPLDPVAGMLYFDQTTNLVKYYNGTQFVDLGAGAGIVQQADSITNIFNTTVGGGGITAVSSTPGTIPKFITGQSIGNSLVKDDGTTVTVNGNLDISATSTETPPELTLFTPSSTPVVEAATDPLAVELGVKFRADKSGFVKGIRFYKGATNTGTHIGNLWTNTGVNLGAATFTNETATGWQEVRFASPIAIAAETTYVASYHTTVGHYANTENYFLNGGADNGVLHGLQHGSDGGNGLFRYSATPAFPTTGFLGINYWVDVIFSPNPDPPTVSINGVPISSANLSNNTEIAKRGSSQVFSGNNTFRSASNSTTAFSIQNSTSSSLLTADTANNIIYLGNPDGSGGTTLLVLSGKSTIGDPGGTDGAIYYNAAQDMFRCYRNGFWDACAELETDRGYSVYDEFLGGQSTSFTSDNIGSLGWNAQAIGANGSLSYNPATPAPEASRPGVLALQTPGVINQGTTLSLANASGGSMLISRGTIAKTTVAAGNTTGQVLRVGIHNQTTSTTAPTRGVWWEFNPDTSTRWQYCFGDGTTATCTATPVIVVANEWTRLEIRILATGAGTSRASFIINGTTYDASNVTIDSTNTVSPALTCFATAGAARSCFWDYFHLKGTSDTIR